MSSDPTFRDCMIEIADDVRQDILVDCFERRLHRILVRTRTWSGTQTGQGTATDVDLELTPRPKVRIPEPRATTNEGGEYERGDLVVSKISATYSRQELGDIDDSALADNVEIFWVKVDDLDNQDGTPDTREEHYHLLGLELRYTAWVATLTRKIDRRF